MTNKRQKQVPSLRCGMTSERTKAKCGGPSTAAAKCAASGRDDGCCGWIAPGRDDEQGKGQYGDSGCARMTNLKDKCGESSLRSE